MNNLTYRQQEYVYGIACGLTQQQVAEMYGVSHTTIRNTLQCIYKKTNTRNETQLVLWALREAKKVEGLWPRMEASASAFIHDTRTNPQKLVQSRDCEAR